MVEDTRKVCPDCGGPKKPQAKKCKSCYYSRGYRVCSEPGCTNLAMTKGLCNMHRLRLRRHGTTELLCSCGQPAVNHSSTPRCEKCRETNRALAARRNGLSRLYGLSVEAYNALLKDQGNVCRICGTDSPGRNHANWSVDHDHLTGRVRGLLCHRCNVGVGHFDDDPSRLRRAADYLEAALDTLQHPMLPL